MMRVSSFVLLVGCGVGSGDDVPAPESDASETDTTADTDVSVVRPAHTEVQPPSPAFDDDLWCALSASAASTSGVAVRWKLNGRPYTGPTSTRDRAGDLVDDLAQHGGESWACEAVDGQGTVVEASLAVVVGHPVPMVELPAGTVTYTSQNGDATPAARTLTRPAWMGAYEVTVGEFQQFLGRVPQQLLTAPEQPVSFVSFADIASFANAVSVADGLPPCFTCTGGGTPTCTRPADIYACRGYRLPTELEWFMAVTEGGRHADPLPAGGTFTEPECFGNDSCYELYGGFPDPVVTGPFAPPETTVGSQCVYFQNSFDDDVFGYVTSPVGTKLPNRFGMYDLCGNASETLADQRDLTLGVLPTTGVIRAPVRTVGGEPVTHAGWTPA
jgi:hypothetical protein